MVALNVIIQCRFLTFIHNEMFYSYAECFCVVFHESQVKCQGPIVVKILFGWIFNIAFQASSYLQVI
jgi:hypothetical protein